MQEQEESTPAEKPGFGEALRFWVRLGFISFGGPAGQIAMLHDYLVEQKRWISPAKFARALNYCMLLPGPEAQQLATYTGWLLHGTLGGLAAGILFILPSAFILLALSILYVQFGQVPAIVSVFGLLKPAVAAIVFHAIYRIGKRSLRNPLQWVVSVLAFLAIYALKLPFPAVILSALAFGAVHYYLRDRNPGADAGPSDSLSDRNEKSISLAGLLKIPATGLLLWALPLPLLYFFAGKPDFWKLLAVFFTKSALVTFGGAYAVLPYIAQVSVERFSWLSAPQMIDGLALGETTPGPLIMVLAFVGFMAAYGTYGGSILAGAAGLFATVWYTFLPSFVMVFLGAPLMENTPEKPVIRSALDMVTAAVTGVMLSLGVFLARAVLIPDDSGLQWLALGWMLLSFALLHWGKWSILRIIGFTILAGMVRYVLMFYS